MSDTDIPVQPLGPYKEQAKAETPAVEATADGAAATPDAGEAPSHYKTLQDADRAARDFQSKFDTATAELKKVQDALAPFGGLAEAQKLVHQVAALSSRADFKAYQEGKLGVLEDTSESDEYLTDEQREIKTLRGELEQLKRGFNGEQTLLNSDRAALKFEAAEKEMRDLYGSHWDTRRPQILEQIRKLGVNSGPQGLNLIDAKLLNQAFLASFESPREYEEWATKWVADRNAARRASLPKGTTPPHQEAPAAEPTATPKTPYEAWQRGVAEAKAKLNGASPT